MGIKSVLLNLYYLPLLPKQAADANQKKIREAEWSFYKKYIPEKARFLDVGCGTGYVMSKAKNELNCECYGIDPNPGSQGAGKYDTDFTSGMKIMKAEAEELPFEDCFFDVVFCSHVLEHVADEKKSLEEMKRVLKPNGILIIGMPTAAMAFINLITDLLFTTHHRIVNVFLSPFISTTPTPFWGIFIPQSHSFDYPKTIFYDLKHYKISSWRKTVSSVFRVNQTLLPALYCYPQYRQLFKIRLNAKWSSSVFFICSK